MHIKCDDPKAFEEPWLVYLDGVRLDWCVEASEEEGWAKCYALNEKGQPAYDQKGFHPFEIKKGKVEFRKEKVADDAKV